MFTNLDQIREKYGISKFYDIPIPDEIILGIYNRTINFESLDQENSYILLNIARSELHSGDCELAANLVRKCIQMGNPTAITTHLYINSKNPHFDILSYVSKLNIRLLEPCVLNYVGHEYVKLNNSEMALFYFQKSLKLEAFDQIEMIVADLYFRTEAYSEALQIYLRFNRTFNALQCYIMLGDLKSSLNFYDRFLRENKLHAHLISKHIAYLAYKNQTLILEIICDFAKANNCSDLYETLNWDKHFIRSLNRLYDSV